ncbi:MAG: hypothetical protein J6Y34_07625 [Bacteroidales bacterium]|nr:hypothetical protein [Bacteroidales bacterium]
MILKNNNISILFVIVLLNGCFSLSAQKYLSAPYSRFGWGEMQPRSSQLTQAMGGAALAFRSPVCVNSKNPASYTAFDSLSVVIDAAVSFRTHRLTEEGQRQQGSTAYADYFSFGLPVTRHWAVAFGIQPFSIVSYDYSYVHEKGSSNDIGEGGTYEVFWGNGFQLTSRLSFGVQASYLFGAAFRSHELVFSDADALHLRSVREDVLGGFLFNAGLQYQLPVGRNQLGMGLSFTPSLPACLHLDRREYHLTYRVSTAIETPVDTLFWEGEEKGVRRLQLHNPATLGAGLSLSQADKFWTGVDCEWAGWSRFSVGDDPDSLNDRMRVSIGGGWTPQSGSPAYLKRMTYSAGFFYEKDYVLLNQMSFYRMGMDIGLAFPVRKNRSKIGVCMESGLYAPAEGEGIRERYYRFTVHVQLHEKWYQHRKLD